jgi:hypothetical protein
MCGRLSNQRITIPVVSRIWNFEWHLTYLMGRLCFEGQGRWYMLATFAADIGSLLQGI